MKTSSKPAHRGYLMNVGEFNTLKYYPDIIDKIINQVEALLTYHSRITVIRLDLKFPVDSRHSVTIENQMLSHFIKLIKENLSLKRWGSHSRVIHTWVLEKNRENDNHYHVMIGFKHTQLSLGCFDIDAPSGLIEVFRRCASKAFKGSVYFAGSHTVNRACRNEIQNCIYHLSYMAKTRTKIFKTNETHRRFSSSELRPIPAPQIQDAA